MKIIWAVICESSSTDQETNNISLFNLLDEIHLPEPPNYAQEAGNSLIAPVRLSLVALFTRSESDQSEEQEARIVVHFPDDGEPYIFGTFEVDLESVHRLRAKFNLPGIPVRSEGEYLYRIQGLDQSEEWHDLFELPLRIDFLTNE